MKTYRACFRDQFGNPPHHFLWTICIASLEPLAHHWNVTSLSLFCRYYFGRWLSELAQLATLPDSQGRSPCYFDILHDFPVTIPRCYRMSISTVSFLAQIDSRNSLSKKMLLIDLWSGFKSRLSRCL